MLARVRQLITCLEIGIEDGFSWPAMTLTLVDLSLGASRDDIDQTVGVKGFESCFTGSSSDS